MITGQALSQMPPACWTARDALRSKACFALNAIFCGLVLYQAGPIIALAAAVTFGSRYLAKNASRINRKLLQNHDPDPRVRKILAEFLRHPEIGGGKYPIKMVIPVVTDEANKFRIRPIGVDSQAQGSYILQYTRGALDTYGEAKFRGLLGHELGHPFDYRYGDAEKTHAVYMLSLFTAGAALLCLKAAPLLPLAGAFLAYKLYKRVVEFRCDRSSATLTQNPNSLIEVLEEGTRRLDEKIKKTAEELSSHETAIKNTRVGFFAWLLLNTAMAGVNGAQRVATGLVKASNAGMIEFLFSHPNNARRIHRLRRMAAALEAPRA